MKIVDTYEYVSVLRELTEEGQSVSMLISGSSMSPFLAHQRDYIYFEKPKRPLKKGDMVFYQRDTGQYVMHRICRVCKDGTFHMVGDAQIQIEKGIRPDQIFALITQVKRKNRLLKPGDFWWDFFQKVWIRMIPLRPLAKRVYSVIYRLRKQGSE
ncbi:MAG: S24/S26 family peptidase [Lachnospiraceae bacterium]|nr:S24/S26 family peptidase [Lachnospiraceae bacterium]